MCIMYFTSHSVYFAVMVCGTDRSEIAIANQDAKRCINYNDLHNESWEHRFLEPKNIIIMRIWIKGT